MNCPVCGAKREEPVCRVCGWDVSRDWAAFPTVFFVSPRDLPGRAQRRRQAERQFLSSRLEDLLFSDLTAEELETCLAGEDPAEAARRLLRRYAPEALRPRSDGRWQNNFLRNDGGGTLPASPLPREEVQLIRFRSALDGLPRGAWDASAAGNGSVMAFLRREDGLNTLTLCGEGGVRAALDSRGLFSGYRNLIAVEFAGAFHTSGCRNMSSMFEGCRSLKSLDLSSFDTWSATNMSSMFSDCADLVSLDLRSFRTWQVTDMGFMFAGCSRLTALDIRIFDTGQTENMGSMFSGCASLETLDVRGFRTDRVKNMSFMFFGCKALRGLDIRGFVIGPGCTATGMLGGVGAVVRR